MTIITIL